MVDPYQVLPREIFRQIFLPLDVEDRFNCIEVNELWGDFITSDTHLWRSSIVFRTECDPEMLQRCLNYAFGTSSQSIALDTVRIVVSPENFDSNLRLLSKGLFGQRVKQINCFSLDIKDFAYSFENYWGLPVPYSIYYLVPISNFHVVIYGFKTIHLDRLLASQEKSLIQLSLYCYSVCGRYEINRAPLAPVCPMLKDLYLSFRDISRGGIQSISGCTNLRLLELANVSRARHSVPLNHLLNNIPDGLQALNLCHLSLHIDLRDEGGEWPKNLRTLQIIHSNFKSNNGGDILGSLEGLRELLICDDVSRILEFYLDSNKRVNLEGVIDSFALRRRSDYCALDLVEFFDRFKCGKNLRVLFLDAVNQIPDPNLYQNVELLYLSNVSLGDSFLSECYKLTKVKDVHFAHVGPSSAELMQCLITLAKNNVETVHLAKHGLSRSNIKKITKLGVTEVYVDTEG